MKAIRVHEFGGPEVLRYEDLPLPEPGAGEARVRLAAIGVNFIDVYHRKGQYPGKLPLTLGREGAGVVDAVGAGVADVKPGDQVAYEGVMGAYAEHALVPAEKLVLVPDGVSLDLAAATMLQGMTAHYLAHSTFPLKPGDTALVHAAAGGVGQLLVQIAKRRGARVIGTASAAKLELARAAGADEVISYNEDDFEAAVRSLTGGKGVDVVYDSVGKTTFDKSLNCLRPRGYMVLYWPVQRAGTAARPAGAQRQRLAVSNTPDAGALHRHARGAAESYQRPVRLGCRRRAEGDSRHDLPARQGRRCPSLPRGPPDQGQSAADPIELRMEDRGWRIAGHLRYLPSSIFYLPASACAPSPRYSRTFARRRAVGRCGGRTSGTPALPD